MTHLQQLFLINNVLKNNLPRDTINVIKHIVRRLYVREIPFSIKLFFQELSTMKIISGIRVKNPHACESEKNDLFI